MNTNTHQGTAKIYQFPVRSRSVVVGHRDGPASEFLPRGVCEAALDACWYHDDAVKQADASIKP
jgi:hypothetical protein